MYWYRDTERNIPNTFNTDLLVNKDYCIAGIIYLLDNDFIKRKDLTDDVLKRVDAEIAFQIDPTIKNIPNFFAPSIHKELFSVNEIIEYLKLGSIRISQLTTTIAIRVDKLDEFNRYKVSKLDSGLQ